MSTLLPKRFNTKEEELVTEIHSPRVVIIYHTLYGSTQQYAKWILEHLNNADFFHIDEFDSTTLDNYQIIVVGGPTTRGKISVESFIKNHSETLKNKYVYVFATGIIPWKGNRRRDAYQRIPLHLRSSIQYIKLPGKVDPSKLSLFDRLYLRLNGVTEYDQMNIKYTQPIVNYIKAILEHKD